MSAGRASSRLEAQAAEQRWAHVRGLCAGEAIELMRYDGRQSRVLAGDVDTVQRQAGQNAEPATPDMPGIAEAGLLVIDLLLADLGVDTAADAVADAMKGERQTIVWAPPGDLSRLSARFPVASEIEIFEQVSVEGVMIAKRDDEVIPTEVDVASSLREGVVAIVACANLAGLAEPAAKNVAALEAGNERTHLVTALTELRRTNVTLGKAQRGKSQAAASAFVQATERRVVQEFEERQRVEKNERDAWIAGLQEEIVDLKQRIEIMEARRAWRLAERLDAWRGRSRPS